MSPEAMTCNPVQGGDCGPVDYLPAVDDLVVTLNDTPIMGGGNLFAGEVLKVTVVWRSQGRQRVTLVTLVDPISTEVVVSGLRADRVRPASTEEKQFVRGHE